MQNLPSLKDTSGVVGGNGEPTELDADDLNLNQIRNEDGNAPVQPAVSNSGDDPQNLPSEIHFDPKAEINMPPIQPPAKHTSTENLPPIEVEKEKEEVVSSENMQSEPEEPKPEETEKKVRYKYDKLGIAISVILAITIIGQIIYIYYVKFM